MKRLKTRTLLNQETPPEQERKVVGVTDGGSTALIWYHGDLIHGWSVSCNLAVGAVGGTHYSGYIELVRLYDLGSDRGTVINVGVGVV